MPTLKLAGGKSGTTRSTPKRKPAAKSTPKRKPAATSTPKRKAPARKPAAQTQENGNGGNGRSPRLPEGWSKRDLDRAIKDMQKARSAKEAAAEKLAEAQESVNEMALTLLDEGVQMSVISTELNLSRQWMYTLIAKRDEAKPARKRAAKKPAAKQAAKQAPARKQRPASKQTPARKRPPQSSGRGRVKLAA